MAAIPRTTAPSDHRAPLLGIVLLAALALGVALLWIVPDATRLPAGGRAVPVLAVLIGWAFAAVGCLAWRLRPDNPTGALLTAFGFTVLLSGFSVADDPLPYLISTIADPLAIAVFLHLLLAFPSGRLEGRASRRVVAAGYVTALGGLVAVPFDADLGDPECAGCPRNLLLIEHDGTVAELASLAQDVIGLALIAAGIGLALRRWRAAGPAERRSFTPLLAAGTAVLALGAASATAQNAGAGADVERLAQLVFIAAFAGLPAAFLIGLARTRFFRTATVSGLLDRLTAERAAGDVGGALASALGDPSLTVAYWLPDQDAYVDRDGRPFTPPSDGDGSTATELVHQGRRVGVLVHDAALADDATLLAAAAGAAALALENDRLEVELRAQVQALRESRARIVEAGDVERRRLGRDLHDGAQQRLISVLIELQLADERWQADPGAARELVGRALGNARSAVDELRELAAGIHPAVLSQRGLDAAAESLAARSSVPVELDVELAERLPSAVETAAYFVISEALANVAKHARATHARVTVRRAPDAAVVVEIADDGAGGADAGGGSGLRGLADRVGALDGTLTWQSPEGGGTVVRARFPPP